MTSIRDPQWSNIREGRQNLHVARELGATTMIREVVPTPRTYSVMLGTGIIAFDESVQLLTRS